MGSCEDWTRYFDDNDEYKSSAVKYIVKLGKNCIAWATIPLHHLPYHYVDRNLFVVESTSAMRNGQPLRDFNNDKDNRKVRKACRGFLKLELLHRQLLDCGVDEQLLNKAFREYMILLNMQQNKR